MNIIKITAFENGAHDNLISQNNLYCPEDWAIIPDDINLPKNFPFVDIEVEDGIVTKMIELPLPQKDINEIKKLKIQEIKQECNAWIEKGTFVKFSDGTTQHFTYTLADQSNISEMFTAIMAGATEYPYHADGTSCQVYTKEQITVIYGTLSMYKTEATTYHNSLKSQIKSLESVKEVEDVKYHKTKLTGEFLENYNTMMKVAQEQLEAVLGKIS